MSTMCDGVIVRVENPCSKSSLKPGTMMLPWKPEFVSSPAVALIASQVCVAMRAHAKAGPGPSHRTLLLPAAPRTHSGHWLTVDEPSSG